LATSLNSEGKAPEELRVDGTLDLTQFAGPLQLPEGLSCDVLLLGGTQIVELPAKLNVEVAIDLSGCEALTELPKGLQTGTLEIRNCLGLTSLPENLDIWYLDASGCTSLANFPKKAKLGRGDLNFSGCSSLKKLPNYLDSVSALNISDCPGITELPRDLRINLWIDVGGSGLTSLPESVRAAGLRWQGVPVDYKIAFHPETIAAKHCLKEPNTEKRRVMIERMGTERFIEEAEAKRLDQDTDPGGKRELLRVALEGDEDLVCLSCFCPSTKRHYFLRVPPTTSTCHQAAAWMAGFDDPSKYSPVIET